MPGTKPLEISLKADFPSTSSKGTGELVNFIYLPSVYAKSPKKQMYIVNLRIINLNIVPYRLAIS